jgi:hypothetical protein
MKRVLLSACLVFGSFGLTGCDSGGIPAGQPDSTKEAVPIGNVKSKMEEGPKMPGKDTPKPAAPDAPKN